MEDQVRNLNDRNISAVYLSSNMIPSKEKEIFENIKNGIYKLIYISPERLQSKKVSKILETIKISMIVFDEVHCLSEWGHDFRPDYKRVAESVKHKFNNIQIVSLTATITEKAKLDTINILKMNDPFISSSSFNRENIYLGVKKFWTIWGKTKFLKNKIIHSKKCLIYCSSRQETETISEKMSYLLNINTSFYHAGCSNSFRKDTQNKFKNGEIKCLFATTAFGMGIDISDIDTVIYWNCASSIEEYYQGIGRSGRDKDINAESWVIYTNKDLKDQAKIIDFEIPDKKLIQSIIKSINENQSLNKIKYQYKVSELIINSIKIICESNDSIEYIIGELNKIKKSKSDKFENYKRYLKYNKCKRKYILNYFSENAKDKCHNCINCK